LYEHEEKLITITGAFSDKEHDEDGVETDCDCNSKLNTKSYVHRMVQKDIY